MISRKQLEILCRHEVRQAIDRNIERDPVAVALDKRIPFAAEVATQVKYLQRARRKLPSYYEARCIVPPLAFEQASSEECAAHKRMSGSSAVDLTCGLGVDSAAMSRRFGRVVAVERDEVLAEVARENFRRMGIGNIEVVCSSAERFAAECRERFDWCFADPDRRGADGRKKVVAADCSPDVAALLPQLRRMAGALCFKMSPMFDVDEALGQFEGCSVEAVSLGDECKEVLVYIDGAEPSLTASAIGLGEFGIAARGRRTITPEPFDPAACRWLVQPDVALRKARLVGECFAGRGFVTGENGFVFFAERPQTALGRIYEIERAERYDPKQLRRTMKGCRPRMLLRDVPMTLAQIERDTRLRNGSDGTIAFTSVRGEIWAVHLK